MQAEYSTILLRNFICEIHSSILDWRIDSLFCSIFLLRKNNKEEALCSMQPIPDTLPPHSPITECELLPVPLFLILLMRKMRTLKDQDFSFSSFTISCFLRLTSCGAVSKYKKFELQIELDWRRKQRPLEDGDERKGVAVRSPGLVGANGSRSEMTGFRWPAEWHAWLRAVFDFCFPFIL